MERRAGSLLQWGRWMKSVAENKDFGTVKACMSRTKCSLPVKHDLTVAVIEHHTLEASGTQGSQERGSLTGFLPVQMLPLFLKHEKKAQWLAVILNVFELSHCCCIERQQSVLGLRSGPS